MFWWCWMSPWTSWPALRPQEWTWSPEGVVDTRYTGDRYTDTASGIVYVNTNASGNTGWEVIQTMPAS